MGVRGAREAKTFIEVSRARSARMLKLSDAGQRPPFGGGCQGRAQYESIGFKSSTDTRTLELSHAGHRPPGEVGLSGA